jgi:hypothetical protein
MRAVYREQTSSELPVNLRMMKLKNADRETKLIAGIEKAMNWPRVTESAAQMEKKLLQGPRSLPKALLRSPIIFPLMVNFEQTSSGCDG